MRDFILWLIIVAILAVILLTASVFGRPAAPQAPQDWELEPPEPGKSFVRITRGDKAIGGAFDPKNVTSLTVYAPGNGPGLFNHWTVNINTPGSGFRMDMKSAEAAKAVVEFIDEQRAATASPPK